MDDERSNRTTSDKRRRMSVQPDKSENQSGRLPKKANPTLLLIGGLLALALLGCVSYYSQRMMLGAGQYLNFQRKGNEGNDPMQLTPSAYSESIAAQYYMRAPDFTHPAVACTMSLPIISAKSSGYFQALLDQAASGSSPQWKTNDEPVHGYAAASLKYPAKRAHLHRQAAMEKRFLDHSERKSASFLLARAFGRAKLEPDVTSCWRSSNARHNFEAPIWSTWSIIQRINGYFTTCLQRPYLNAENSSLNRKASIGVAVLLLAIIFVTWLVFALFSFIKEFGSNQVIAQKRLDDRSKALQGRPRQAIQPQNKTWRPRRSILQSLSFFDSSLFSFSAIGMMLILFRPMEATQDLRESIINGMEPCFHYTYETRLFRMNCSVLHWQAQGYGPNTYISLSANEIFEGGSAIDNTRSYIDLSGITDFTGLFTIEGNEVTTFAKTPLIRNVHVKNGTVAEHSGYIAQKEQRFFIIDSCSSSGEISVGAGGISGSFSGSDNGEIKIVNSYSTGSIVGSQAGGITGQLVGYNEGIVHITQCYSTGHIMGQHAGGICGKNAGHSDGRVYIRQSYSTGDIGPGASSSGGIVGSTAGSNNGYVDIQQSYSTGHISSDYSGGICGPYAAYYGGEVNIRDCYTRGDINSQYSGGITGHRTGGYDDDDPARSTYYGDVNITNSYVSGALEHTDAGAIVGTIFKKFQGHTIRVQYSVYKDEGEGELVGRDFGNHLEDVGISNDLNTIRGQLYHYDGVQRWDNDAWCINGTETLPILCFQLPLSASPSPTSTSTPTPTTSTTNSITPSPTCTSTPTTTRNATSSPTHTPTRTVTPMEMMWDLRESIIQRGEPCFHYTMEKSLFYMNCSVLHWKAQGYGSKNYISLGANEIFDGGSTDNNEESYIDLSGIIDFEGLLIVNENMVTTFAEAPLIMNVHCRNGTVADAAGFIVQKEQKFFMIESCSSTGDIVNSQAGGVCGSKSGLDNGEIKISNSYSTGEISGVKAGGITGGSVGFNGGIVKVTQCYSTGDMLGEYVGGICGWGSGAKDGKVYIRECYSTGDIVFGADNSGGVVGGWAGWNKGYVDIQQCFSSGQISGRYSGGISGSSAGLEEGEVHIADCYTLGDIDGQNGGGITGRYTGGLGSSIENFGDVRITNTYASGLVKHADAGGIIGSIHPTFQGHNIYVLYSVYSSDLEGKIIGQHDNNSLNQTGNSRYLSSIRGQLYQYQGVRKWNNNKWFINGADNLPLLRFQLQSTPSPSPTSASTQTPTASITSFKTTTASRTRTSTATRSPTSSITDALASTVTPTETSSRTATPTPTTTSTSSCTSVKTETATCTQTQSVSAATPARSPFSSSIYCSPKLARNPYSTNCFLQNLTASNISEIEASEMDHQLLTFRSKLPVHANDSLTHSANLLPYLTDRHGYSVFLDDKEMCIVAGLKLANKSNKSYKYSSDVCCSNFQSSSSCTSDYAGVSPKPRAYASSWSNGKDHYFFGGQGEILMDGMHGLLDDLWKYDLDLDEWTMVHIKDGPSARRDSSTWVVEESFLLFGGYGLAAAGPNPTYLNDLWKLQSFPTCPGREHEWRKLKPWSLSGNLPSARRQSSVTMMNSIALMFGGEGFASSNKLKRSYLSDLWALEFCHMNETWRWRELMLTESICGLGGRVGVLLTASAMRQEEAFCLSLQGGFGYQHCYSSVPRRHGVTWSMLLGYNRTSLP